MWRGIQSFGQRDRAARAPGRNQHRTVEPVHALGSERDATFAVTRVRATALITRRLRVFEGTRREFTGVEAGAEHGLVAGAGWRLIGRGAESFEVRVEAELREAANGDVGSEHSVGLRLGASW